MDLLTRTDHAAGLKVKSVAPVDETVVLRRCAQYRDGFKGTAVSFPAALLRFTTTRDWIQRHRLAVDVTTGPELAQAVVAGTEPGRIVVHSRDGSGELTRRAVGVDAGRFVVRSSRHVSRLAAHTQQRPKFSSMRRPMPSATWHRMYWRTRNSTLLGSIVGWIPVTSSAH